MVFINLGISEEDDNSSTGTSELGGLVMEERSQSSASSYESNPEPPAPLRHGQQRPGRPPFRTQLSEPNWTGPLGPSPVSLLHQHASIASPDSDLSGDSQSAAISALYGPDNFRHEPFSVFYGTNGGAAASQLAAGIGTGAIGTLFCCGSGNQQWSTPLDPVKEEEASGHKEIQAKSHQQQQLGTLAAGPFLFSAGASAWLTRIFQQKVPVEIRTELIAEMLQMQTVRFDKNRRSSLVPTLQGCAGADGTASGQSGGAQLSPYGPESLFFCIGQAGSRKNSFAGGGSVNGTATMPLGQFPPGGPAAECAVQQQQGQKQQKRKRAVITMDAHSTQILIASDSVCRLFGFRDRSLIGKKLGQVFPVSKNGQQDLADGVGGPLLLENVFFADPDQQKQLKPVYGKPVEILDADGHRLALSVWSYPLAGPSVTSAAPRKNSAVLLRSPSAFLPSSTFMPSLPQISVPLANGGGAAITTMATGATTIKSTHSIHECSTKVSASSSALSANTNNSLQQRNLNSNNFHCATSPALIGQQQNTTTDLASTQSSQRISPSSSSSSNSSSGLVTAGYTPQLKEVLEEEQQQHSPSTSNNFSYCSPSNSQSSATATKVVSPPQQTTAAKSSAFELDEPEGSALPRAATTTKHQQLQQQREAESGRGGGGVHFALLQQPTTSSISQKTTMVQAGVPIRNVAPGTATADFNSSGAHRKESTDEEAIVIIPINRAEMEIVAMPPAETEPQQMGFLHRQCECEIFPNTSAGTAGQMAIERKNGGGGDDEANKNGGSQLTQNGNSNNSEGGGSHNQHHHHHHQQQQQNGHFSAHQQQQQQQNGNDRWLILMEPIPALFASVILGTKGRIFRVDDAFPAVASILGYDSTNRLLGTEIHGLIPSLNMNADFEAKEQLCCGSTVKHNGVPFKVIVTASRDQETNYINSYEVHIRSIASINGVIILTEAGTVYSYNENLFHQLLGMQFASEEGHDITKLDITDVLPHFFEYLEVAHSHIQRHRQEQQQSEVLKENVKNGGHHRQPSPFASANDQQQPSASFMPTVSHSSSCLFTQELAAARRTLGRRSNSFYGSAGPLREDQAEDEDQPAAMMNCNGNEQKQGGRKPEIIPGIFYGLARHADGMMIPVKIEVSTLDNNNHSAAGANEPRLFAVCIGFDRTMDWGISQMSEEEEEKHEQEQQQQQQESQHEHTPTSASSNGAICGGLKKKPFCLFSGTSSAMLIDSSGRPAPRFSIGGGSLRDCDSDSAVDFVAGVGANARFISDDFLMHSADKIQEALAALEMEDENNEAVCGEYSKNYDTFQLIRNGAFGSVKLAARKDTGLLAVSKFINKSKVLPESWVPSPKRGNRMVPIEVHLLENLNHPNIVKVLDVFENDKFYQLVMEKCGCGMDLFEFIDHQPKLDEPLVCFIFRQIVSAVDYLHQNHIVHRDLKDENVIIDQNFCCKLIDFGSAAFYGDGILFSTFCGTMEYCSPEVLTGNKYLGPEVEMWSMGILLYTLVFFENPFRSAQETVHADIELPWDISEGLYQVLNWLLQPDPKLRATVGDIKGHWWLTQQVDMRRYNFKELLRNCERAQVSPPLYVSDLHNHLKNVSASCSNLASVSITGALNTDPAGAGANGKSATQEGQKPQQQMGIVSAR